MFAGRIFNFKDREHFNDIKNVVIEIKMKDETFPDADFDIENLEMKFKGDKDDLNRRLLWIVMKVDKEKLIVYDVKKVKE